ncbi:27 kDa glycoprotein-like [Pararge aegeria]|uniref:Jg7508 protein n=2 Tax=Pararge aegeria TaxID=116150 RepID=A0A8S4RH60_9NEOP|nr:27 kDa glycoprotein-like [Pararge aegeria]CAH2235098.1 jg7508 [Pararge aegeria aegeria]
MDSKNIIFFMFIGMVSAQTENSLSDALNKLPPELQGKVDETQITEIKNKTISVFKKKCEENAGPEAYNKAEKALTQFNDCLESLVDTEKLQQEIEDAKPTGQVDEVFKKYCQKTPQFKNCFKNITDTVKPCFSVDEQKHLKTIYNISEQLAEFVCFKEGDRIALFISEHGPECIKEKQPEIEKCLNSTLGTEMSFNTNNMSLDNIPTIKFEEKECNQLEDLQVCVVAALEKCSAPTSANIVESLFKFARKATPCKDIPTAEETNATKEPNSASGLVAKSLAMTAIALALLM